MNRTINDAAKLHRAGRLAEAAEIYSHIVVQQPDNADAWYSLGLIAANHDGDYPLALVLIDKAIACNPGLARYHTDRGAVLYRCGRPTEALAAFEEALRLKPDNARAHYNRGVVLEEEGRLGEALAAYDEAVRFRPGYAEAHNNRGVILKSMGRLTEAVAAYQQALHVKPDHAEAQSNYLFCLNYDPSTDDATLAAAHLKWGERFGWPPHAFTAHANVPDPDKTLRVGLVSADFGRHPIGYFLDGVMAAMDSDRVRFFCYSGRLREDDLTVRLKTHAGGWRSTIGASDRELAETIRADAVDILIDLAGHTAGHRLGCFALKPAPVQATWLVGYPFTTGLSAIDYALLDDASVAPGTEGWFVERVVTLGPCRFCYTPPDYAPAPAPPPLLRRGHPTFGSFNNLAKVTPEVAGLWARILWAVPGARLILKWSALADPEVRARYLGLFADQGIDPARLDLRGKSPHAATLGEYADIDVALDPFPYAGGLTSAEALWMGVPVVTLPGTRPASRQSQVFLAAFGRTEWVARDAEDYVRIAAALVADPERLAALRREQRGRIAASPVCDAPRFARRLEGALRAMWRAWCEPRSHRPVLP